MRKFIILLFLLFSVLVNAQIKLLCNGAEISTSSGATVYSNTDFNLGISVSCVGCSNYSVVLNKGSLLYNPNNNVVYPTGVSVPTGGVTATSITFNITSCSTNQIIYIPFKFDEVCENTSAATVTLSASVLNCSVPVVNNNVTIHAQNILPTTNFYISGSTTQLCRGQGLITFQLGVQNPPEGALLSNATLKFRVPSCAIIANANTLSITPGIGYQEIKWNLTDLLAGHSIFKTVSFNLPCSTCPAEFIAHPSLLLEGTKCNGTAYSLLNDAFPTTTFTAANPGYCFDDSTCTLTSPAVTPNVSLNFTANPFTCPNAQIAPKGTYTLGIPSALSLNNLNFITKIPNQTNLVSVKISSAIPSGCTLSSFSYELNNSTIWIPLTGLIVGQNFTMPVLSTGQNISRIRWIFAGNMTGNLSLEYTYSYLNNVSIPPYLNGYGGGFTCDALYSASNLPNPVPVSFDRNIQGNVLSNCLGILELKNRIRGQNDLDNVTDDFTQSISVMPNGKATYLLSMRTNNLSNLVLSQIIPANLIFIGNFKYAYGTASAQHINNPLLDLNFTGCSNFPCALNIPSLGSPIFNFVNNEVLVSNINFPSNAETLYVRFDVQLNTGLMFNNSVNVSTKCKVSQTLNSITQSVFPDNYCDISVIAHPSVKSTIAARCVSPTLGEWKEDVINIRDNEKLDFKIEIENTGSIYLNVNEIQNLKPMLFDTTINDPGIPRGSQFNVNYFCQQAPSVTKIPATSQTCQIFYSVAGPNKNRDLFCSPISTGVNSNWDLNNCLPNSNWVKFFFSNNGLRLNPGERLIIIFRGKVSGATTLNATAVNSFNMQIHYDGGFCPTLIEDSVTIVNDGQGCNPPCIDCASFGLIKGEKYLVSGWVKEEDPKEPSKQVKDYLNSFIHVFFTSDVIPPATLATYDYSIYPTGDIIDGWQRMVGEITVPGDASTQVGDLIIELKNAPTRNKVVSYFDDIRILPSKGNMKSFVYDQKTQRLMAELDENNYATFYEYDLEGGLIRIKKETEKGVFTIQETRSGNVKVGGH